MLYVKAMLEAGPDCRASLTRKVLSGLMSLERHVCALHTHFADLDSREGRLGGSRTAAPPFYMVSSGALGPYVIDAP